MTRPIRSAIRDAATVTGVSEQDILGRSRERHITRARDHAAYLARQTGASYPKIARVFDRDHTSIRDAVLREEKRRQE